MAYQSVNVDYTAGGVLESSAYGPDISTCAKQFTSRGQFPKLIRAVAVRWLLTIIFCGAIVGTLVGYSSKTGLVKKDKRVFNGIFVILSIILGLNVVARGPASLKVMARILRWRILARSRRSLAEFDRVLNFESFWNVLVLIFNAASWRFRAFCFAWLAIAVLYQVAIAVIGTNYSIADAIIWSKEPAKATITDFSAVYGYHTDIFDPPASGGRDSRPDQAPPLYEQQTIAHSLALMGSGIEGSIENITERSAMEEAVLRRYPISFYLNDEKSPVNSLIYFTRIYNPDEKADDIDESNLALPSDRSVEISQSCSSFNAAVTGSQGSGEVTIETEEGLQTVFVPEIRKGAKTVMFDPLGDCGPRCAKILGFELPFNGRDAFYYVCHINVSEVRGARDPKHEIPDGTAQLAAASMGLTGYYFNETDFQWQTYPLGTGWGIPWAGNAIGFGANAVMLATYCLHLMDKWNPILYVEDRRPISGYVLTVRWRFVGIIVGVIVGSQLLFSILTVFWGNKAVVLDSSFLPISRLLRSVTEPLGHEGGCMLTGKEVAAAYPRSRGVNRRDIVYGISSMQTTAAGMTIYQLDIADYVEPRSGAFPEGWYDGPMARERCLGNMGYNANFSK